MLVAGLVVEQRALLHGVFDQRQVDHIRVRRIRGELEGVQRDPCIAIGALDQVLHASLLQVQMTFAQTSFSVGEGAVDDHLDIRVGKGVQGEYAYSGQQRRIDLERGVLGCRANQGDRAVFGVRQHRVLLSLVPAMHLVDKQDGSLLGHAPRLVDDFSQIGDARRYRRHCDKARVAEPSDDLGQRCFARAWRPPQHHAGHPIRLERSAEGATRRQEVLLAEDFVQRPRPHTRGQRQPAVRSFGITEEWTLSGHNAIVSRVSGLGSRATGDWRLATFLS